MITNARLLNWNNQIAQTIQQDHFTAQDEFYGVKMRNFVEKYSSKIKAIHEKQRSVLKEFFVFENESVKMNEDKTPVLLEGKTMAEYERIMNDFLQKPIGGVLSQI